MSSNIPVKKGVFVLENIIVPLIALNLWVWFVYSEVLLPNQKENL